MPLHRLTSITMGVPSPWETAQYYADFGLTPSDSESATGGTGLLAPGADVYRFSTVDGGEQLRIVAASRRRLLQIGIGVDDPDDLDRAASSLANIDIEARRDGARVLATDPNSEVGIVLEVAPRYEQAIPDSPLMNKPGLTERHDQRAPGVVRETPVRPRKLGHVVIGSPDQEASTKFFTEGLGFKVSDRVPFLASFMRCSTDHHNVLVQQAPVSYLHHTSWQVDDVDEIGRGATSMLAKDPNRHVWGLGRHFVGSNYFWYLRDPAGNFSEYYSDIDCIVDDQLWKPGIWEGDAGLYAWGPPPPPSFLAPEDLAGLMAGAHSAG